jgi:hypothetical protein
MLELLLFHIYKGHYVFYLYVEELLKSHSFTKTSRKFVIKINVSSVKQNYCFFLYFSISGILETRKHDVSETGSVSVLR